jgi:hypothetical protein
MTALRAFQPLSPSIRLAHQPARRGCGTVSAASECGVVGSASLEEAIVSPTGSGALGMMLPPVAKNGAGSRTVERRRGDSDLDAAGSPAIAGTGSGFAAPP